MNQKKQQPGLPLRLALGFCVSGAMALMAFEWRSPTQMSTQFLEKEDFKSVYAINPIRINPPKPPEAKKHLQKSSQEILDAFALDENPSPVVEKEEPKTEQTSQEAGPELSTDFMPEPDPLANSVEPTIMDVVHDSPYFKECGILSKKEIQFDCFDQKLRSHLNKHLRYPEKAKRLGLEDKMYIQFVVDVDGSIEIKEMVSRHPGYFEDEVKRVFDLLPTLIPGKVQGRPVPVLYAMPLNFKLRS